MWHWGAVPWVKVPKWLLLLTCIARVTSHVGGVPFYYKVERKRPAGHLGMAAGPLGMVVEQFLQCLNFVTCRWGSSLRLANRALYPSTLELLFTRHWPSSLHDCKTHFHVIYVSKLLWMHRKDFICPCLSLVLLFDDLNTCLLFLVAYIIYWAS